jgi:hypothetical protein
LKWIYGFKVVVDLDFIELRGHRTETPPPRKTPKKKENLGPTNIITESS